MSTNLKKARKKLEALLVRLGLAVLPYWPRWMILGLARLTGIFAYYSAPGSRRLTITNLEIAFGQRKSMREKKRIAFQSFQLMARVFLDYFWFAKRSSERVAKYIILDKSVSLYFPVPPAVVVTAHFGNWELLSRGMAAAGYDHEAVSAPLSNPAVNEIIISFRTTDNAKMIPMHGAVRRLLRALHKGKLIALLLDQNTKPGDGGIFVDFFGLPVPMSTSAAILAERVKAPIVPLFCVAQPKGNYLIYALPPFKVFEAQGADNIHDTTQKIAAVFQQEIEKNPQQWMWMYKRWKHIKPGMPAEAYPYYAKPLS
ncbi:lysophospholipid acyltransferase family protein [Verrucomicrobiota bacterium]